MTNRQGYSMTRYDKHNVYPLLC